jgi:two-component system invasion response regulator UvrY
LLHKRTRLRDTYMKKFLLADDHSIIRTGLRILLMKEYPDAEITEAVNEKQACQFLRKDTFSLVFMDINMPESDPFRLIQYIHSHYTGTPVIVFSMNDEKSFASRFFKMGIKGYINKSASDNTILEAVRQVLNKGVYMSAELKDNLLNSFVFNNPENPFDKLADREFEVVRELLAGKSIAEIANTLGINISTVSTYKGKAFLKLALRSNSMTELVAMAELHNIQ